VANVFSLILACAGFTADTARTAAHALDRLARRPYAAIIADAELPGISLGDWAAALRGAAPMTPLVVYSLLGGALRPAAALGVGVVLETPVTPDRLVATSRSPLGAPDDGTTASEVGGVEASGQG
jgi:DNA-binding response OmpR family regulator